MLETRWSEERGSADYGWLQAQYSFSFSQYYDPNHVGFSALCVINEDRIAPAMGFGTHGHKNMEIITYILDGELSHKDSLGNEAKILKGQIQKMSAGSGVRHSEFNASADTMTHLLQIWIEPNIKDITPKYAQINIIDLPLMDGWRVVAAPKGEWQGKSGAIALCQDAVLLLAHCDDGMKQREYLIGLNRCVYVHIAFGSALVNSVPVKAGDAVKIWDEPQVFVEMGGDAQILLFDLLVN